jgi:hypothetical protein
LNDPLFANGIGQFPERFRGEILARLQGAGTQPIQRNAVNLVTEGLRRERGRDRGRGRRRG